MHKLTVRSITAEDLPLLLKLHTYRDPEQMLFSNTRMLTSGQAKFFCLFRCEKLIGELRAKKWDDDPDFAIPGQRAYLYAFRILPGEQGQGFGTYLMEQVTELLRQEGYREFTVGVEDDNVRARQLYHKLGFTRVLARKEEEYQGDSYGFDLLMKTE